MTSKLLSDFMGTYDPNEVTTILDNDEVFGFAEGEMITIEKNEGHFNVHVGAKGETTRAAIRDNNYTITIRLQQTSPFVKKFEDYKSAGRVHLVPPTIDIKLVDPSSRDSFFSGTCWLMESPSYTWGSDVGIREYTLFAVGGITSNDQVKGTLNIGVSLGLDIA